VDVLTADLLQVEGRFFIEDGDVNAEFWVTWRHPRRGLSGVYRGVMSGFDPGGRFDTALAAGPPWPMDAG
jgi:hypothetical protein